MLLRTFACFTIRVLSAASAMIAGIAAAAAASAATAATTAAATAATTREERRLQRPVSSPPRHSQAARPANHRALSFALKAALRAA
eukprot:6177778-Pleurochrysis_carterae.AAC.1